MSRLETLYSRYERIVNKNYVYSDKVQRYFKVLYAIKDEITKVEAENRRKNVELSNFLKSTKGLNGSEILMALNK